MPYEAPSLQITQQKGTRRTAGIGPSLIPVFVGEGPAHLYQPNKAVVRANTGSDDVLPFATVTEIIAAGDARGFANYTLGVDYLLVAPNIIRWQAALATPVGGAKKPANGAIYYVTCTARPDASQYGLKKLTSFTDLDREFPGHVDGSQFMYADVSDGTAIKKVKKISPVGLAAYLALESGAPTVYVLQVKPTGGMDSGVQNNYMINEPVDYVTALDSVLAFVRDVYRIVPMTTTGTVTSATLNHVAVMSSPDEGLWRTMFSTVDTSGITSTATLETTLTTAAASYKHFRNSLVYAGTVTKKLQDNVIYTLGDQYVAAALAGLDAATPVQNPLTGLALYNFDTCNGLKMRRVQKNRIAGAGVLIMEQPGGLGTPLFVRHQLTTDMTSLQTQENSLVEIHDYVSYFLYDGLRPYIGKYVITADYLLRLSESTNALISTLKKMGVVIEGNIANLFQDQVNPDTVIMQISVAPPYPGNNIKITLFLE